MKKLFAGFAVLMACALNAQWDTLSTGYNLNYESIDFKDANSGIIVGNDPAGNGSGYVLYTTDRGNTWNYFFSFTIERHDVDFTPIGTVWIVGDSGRFVHKNFPSPSHISDGYLTQNDLYCGYAVNDSAFYCAGQNGSLFRTFDYGLSWNTLSSGTTETIHDIYFTDAANGWIVGDGGFLSATSDSGNTWTFVPQPQFGFADFMGFVYQDTLGANPYVVGEAGAAMFSTNGGVNWYSIATGTTEDIHKIRFGNTQSGIMCGDNGFIFRTEDGGWSWFADSAETSQDLYDIAYAGDTTAFICGDSGVVLRSNVDISSVQQISSSTLAAMVYPNPTDGPLYARVLLHEVSDVTIELFNVTGQLVQSEFHENAGTGEQRFEIPANELTAGVYFARIIANEQVVTLPVIRK